MTEIYVGASDAITFKLFVRGQRANVDPSTNVTVKVTDSTGATVSLSNATVTQDSTLHDVYTYIFPLALTMNSQTYTVNWSYTVLGQAGQRVDLVQVVRPYIYPEEVMDKYPNVASLTYDQVKALEHRARLQIDSLCNQHFQNYHLVKTVRGGDSNAILLNTRFISINSITQDGTPLVLADEAIQIGSNSFGLVQGARSYVDGVPSRYDNDEYSGYTVLYTPSYYWSSGSNYAIDAYAGWQFVPSQIAEACGILINDLACSDHKYYEKGLSDIKAGDWKMTFDPAAQQETGNRVVDQLIAPYVVSFLSVI